MCRNLRRNQAYGQDVLGDVSESQTVRASFPHSRNSQTGRKDTEVARDAAEQ
jgi:hypothetical protein